MTHATLSTDKLPEPSAATAAETSDSGAPALDSTDAESEQNPGTWDDTEAEPDSESHDDSDLQLGGGTLNDEELAAVTAVLGTLAGASEAAHGGAGTAGPSDRTLQRRRQLGLWGRPGPDSWKHAAGLR